MTDYKEEQEMEVEALESIYMEEFTKITDDPLSYRVHIVPNQDGQNNHVAVTLKCMIPETYPDVEPRLEVLLDKGLSDTQHKEIKQILAQQIEENIGMPMIYTLCEAIREYLVENNRTGQDGSEYQEMMRRMALKQKKEDQDEAIRQENEDEDVETKQDLHGTPVTVASFNEWRARFDAEMRGSQKASLKDEATSKLTGRQLWTMGEAKMEDGEAEGDEEEEEDDEDDDDEDYEEEEGKQ